MLGAYIMCDGGYHQWLTISGLKGTVDLDNASFAACLEFVRKDVEALFGREATVQHPEGVLTLPRGRSRCAHLQLRRGGARPFVE